MWLKKIFTCSDSKNSKKTKKNLEKQTDEIIIKEEKRFEEHEKLKEFRKISFSNAVNNLSSNMCKFLPTEQYLVSPISLAMALSMLYEGSNNNIEKNGE